MLAQIIEAIILGLVQGLTEFIPVSSSGHLLVVGELFNFEYSSFAFDLALNLGTLLALVYYFRKDLLDMLKQVFVEKNSKLAILLIVATIPAVVVGAFLLDSVEYYLRNPYLTVLALIVVGIIMLFTDKIASKKAFKDIDVADALIIGMAQVLAFFPGTSRSGITIIAGRFLKLSHEAAARFSFLMAIPVVSAAVLRLIIEPEFSGLIESSLIVVLTGIVVSFVSGLFAIRFMLKFLRNNGLKWFGVYRIIFAIVVILLLINGVN